MPAATGTVTVKYATADGSAKAGTDYSAVSGTLTFTAGAVVEDGPDPDRERQRRRAEPTFTFTLSAPTGGATLGHASATMTIRNDDVAPQLAADRQWTAAARRQNPTPVPAQQPKGTGKHVVLVQMLTGQSRVDSKGFVHYKLRCPVPAVKNCQGTIVLEVRVQAKKKQGVDEGADAQDRAGRVGKVHDQRQPHRVGEGEGHEDRPDAAQGYHRMRVKATVRAKDTQNVKGVTAWIVSVQAPPREITVKNP